MGNNLTSEPWRATIGWGREVRDGLKAKVAALRPETSLQIPSFNILVAGQVGAGKSSFINSIDSALEGEVITCKAQAGQMGTSVTKQFFGYEISSKIRIYDTMGIEANQMETDVRDILQAVDGHVPHGHTFNVDYQCDKEFHRDSDGYIPNPSYANRPHCVAIVVNALSVNYMHSHMSKKLQSLADGLLSRRVPFYIILTHMDKFCPEVQKDVRKIFHSKAVQELVDKMSSRIRGLPVNQIFPVINYAERVEIDPDMDILLLYALRQMLHDTQSYFKHIELRGKRESHNLFLVCFSIFVIVLLVWFFVFRYDSRVSLV